MIKQLSIAIIAIAAFGIGSSGQKKEIPPDASVTEIIDGEKEYKEFLKRNPTVKSLFWKGTGRTMGVRLKSGKEEIYNLDNPAELAAAEAKYGNLPEPPPPPPPVPSKPSKPVKPESGSTNPLLEEPVPPLAPEPPIYIETAKVLPPSAPAKPSIPR